MSKERPILFSAPMVRAILDGTKTQTRRNVKPQPPTAAPDVYGPVVFGVNNDGSWYFSQRDTLGSYGGSMARCPYGLPGDTLWVRETWAPCDVLVDDYDHDEPAHIAFKADLSAYAVGPHNMLSGPLDTYAWDWGMVGTAEKPGWRPSIYMPRWASRITLRITAVRVQRLQDISEADARAEGCRARGGRGAGQMLGCEGGTARDEYRALWDSFNGNGAWDANPWVWALSFERVKP